MGKDELLALLPAWLSEPWQQFLAILFIAVVTAKAADWLVSNFFKGLAGKSKTDLDDQVIALLHKPLMRSVLLLGLVFAATVLPLFEEGLGSAKQLVWTFILLLWTQFALRSNRLLFKSASRNKDRLHAVTESTYPFFDNVGKLAIVSVFIWGLVSIWQWDATGLMASAGVMGIAISFAAKDTLSNLFAGVFIIADTPYRVGDFIVLNSGERGQVSHIGLRSTRMITRDDVEIVVPNSVMGNAKVYNETAGPHVKRRIKIPVGVAYGSDIDQVRGVLIKAATEEPLICKDPSPQVRFRALGNSSLDFELLCWIDEPVLRGRATDSMLQNIYQEFQTSGIEIPFPQQDLYIKDMPKALE